MVQILEEQIKKDFIFKFRINKIVEAPKKGDRNDFCIICPFELYQYITTQDYENIVIQLNHYKRGHYLSSPLAFGVFITLMCLISIIIVGTNLKKINPIALGLIPTGIFFVSMCFYIVFFYKNFQKKYYAESLHYFQILNSIYSNLHFEGIYDKTSLKEVEISVLQLDSNLDYSKSGSPINQYDPYKFCDFNYLIGEELKQKQINVLYGKSSRFSRLIKDHNNKNYSNYKIPNLKDNNNINNNSNHQIIDIDYENYQISQKPLNKSETKKQTIEQLLEPSDLEKFYINAK